LRRADWLLASYQAQKRKEVFEPSVLRFLLGLLNMSSIITHYDLDITNCHLTLSVSLDAINKLKVILSKDKPVGKVFTNTAKTYSFLYWMNMNGQYHVDKEDLATITFSRHEDRLSKAIALLEDNGLISTTYKTNTVKSRKYYTYNTYVFDYKQTSDKTVMYEYDIPICSYHILLGKQYKTDDVINTLSSSLFHICPTDSHLYNNTDAFEQQFLGWYDELSFGDMIVPRGHFSDKDKRYYHYFHTMPREERLSTVMWDGEHVVEVWDAHSAFFIVMGYYLKNFKEYETEKERLIFTKEADMMMKLAVNDRLYSSIQKYHNEHAQYPVTFITRDGMKKQVQKYISKSYSRLFNKNGERTKYIDAQWCRYIDEYFQRNFPTIRQWILNYPRHKETKDVVDVNGVTHKNQTVNVSEIHHDVMPYEFKLISMGLCKDLYKLYRVKSVTVHDAIYMKASDADTISSSTIDDLLTERLGISDKAPRSYALF